MTRETLPCPSPTCRARKSERPVVRRGVSFNGEYGCAVICQACGMRGPVCGSTFDATNDWNGLPRPAPWLPPR